MSETPDFSNLSGNGMLVIHVLGKTRQQRYPGSAKDGRTWR